MDIPQFIFPFTYRKIFWFHPDFGTYDENCYKYLCVEFCVYVSVPLVLIDRLYVKQSRARLNKTKTNNCLLKWQYHFCIPTSSEWDWCWSTSSTAFGVISGLNFGCSSRCVVPSHCFNWQFHNDLWCWASISHVYLSSVYLLF